MTNCNMGKRNIEKGDPYKSLVRYIMPKEFGDYFEVVDVAEEQIGSEMLLHVYLDEKDETPDGRTDLKPNGFYEESLINDFPIRDHRTVLHIRRRRWKDADGKSVSKDWELVAQGTRHSKEFAAFLKEYLGYVPSYSAITVSSLSHRRGCV